MSVAHVTAWLLPLLDSHYGGFCLPVAWSRYLLPGPAGETRLESCAYAALAFAAAATARSLPPAFADHLSFAPLAATLLWSYLYPLHRDFLLAGRRRAATRALLGAAASALAAALAVGFTAALHLYTADTLRFAAALALGRCAVAFVDVLVSPAASFATRGGAFGAAVAVAVAGSTYLDAAAAYLFPSRELAAAFEAIEAVTQAGSPEGQRDFRRAALELLVLTMHIQVAMGFVGIKYLRESQRRINALLAVGPPPASAGTAAAAETATSTTHANNGVSEVVTRLSLGEEPLGVAVAADGPFGRLRVKAVDFGGRAATHGVEAGDTLAELNGVLAEPGLTAEALAALPRPIELGFARPSKNGALPRIVAEASIVGVGSPTNGGKATGGSFGGARERLSSRAYGRHAAWFVVTCALPYLGTRAVFAACQTAATSRLRTRAQVDFLGRLFEDLAPPAFISGPVVEPEGNAAAVAVTSTARLRAVSASEFTVSAYSEALASTFDKSFNLIDRKIFSLPKLALFPGLLFARPTYVGTLLPLSVLLDYVKGKITGAMTARVRYLQKEASAVQSRQQRVYEHDLRHEEQIKLAGAAPFTRARWVALSREASALTAEAAVVDQSRRYVEWLYWSDVLKVSIEVLLAALLEGGTMSVGEVWVNSRVLEDAMDTMMSRARAEADLSSIAADAVKLSALAAAWPSAAAAAVVKESLSSPVAVETPEASGAAAVASPLRSTRRVPCAAPSGEAAAGSATGGAAASSGELRLPTGLGFQRGSTVVRVGGVRGIALKANGALVAVTGANGSGKSSTFALLAAAECAAQPVDLPDSIRLLPYTSPEPTPGTPAADAGITLPGPTVVTLSQTPYHPLFVKPLDWFLVGHTDSSHISSSIVSSDIGSSSGSNSTGGGSTAAVNATAAEWAAAARVAFLANELRFYESQPLNASTLLELQDNWFGSLSGGQRAKADFIRSVFLRPACPSLLLVDEGFAALDPASKALVHAKLKAFCTHSLILCIYHTDSAASSVSNNATSSIVSSSSSSSSSSSEGSGVIEAAAVESGKAGAASGQERGCLANSGFFDANLHFEDGTVQLRPLCGNSN